MATATVSRATHATLSGTTADLVKFVSTQTITLASADAGDIFNLAWSGASGDSRTTTANFVIGTNATAVAIQAALRTLTADTGLTVSGSTDTGPFTVTFVNTVGAQPTFFAPTQTGMTATVTNLRVQKRYSIRVSNRDASTALYFNYNTATVPTSAAAETYFVAAGTSVSVTDLGEITTVRVVGNGNAYSVESY